MIVPQFTAAVAANPAAPATIKPIPSGMFAPLNARIAPTARSAPLTTAVTAPIGPFKAFEIVPQLIAITAANPTAPATIRPMPSGIFAPENVRIAPMASRAVLSSAVITPIGPCKASTIAFQFAATVAAIPTAPASISPMPSGMLAPEKTRIAPITSSAPLMIAVIRPTCPCNTSTISPQWLLTASQIASAPIAISAMPSGIFAPLNVKIAPSASRAAPTKSSVIDVS